MRLSTLLIATSLSVSMAPVIALADSHVLNTSKKDAWVYWQAAGCAGVKSLPSCAVGNNALTVCKKSKLASGESDQYHYKDGTSNRTVLVYTCYNNGKNEEFNYAQTGNKGDKKRCAVLNEGATPMKVKCGYSQTDYDALKTN